MRELKIQNGIKGAERLPEIVWQFYNEVNENAELNGATMLSAYVVGVFIKDENQPNGANISPNGSPNGAQIAPTVSIAYTKQCDDVRDSALMAALFANSELNALSTADRIKWLDVYLDVWGNKND